MNINLSRRQRGVAEELLNLIDVPPASTRLLPNACRNWCGDTARSSPARRHNAASNSLTASGVIGAPTGSRNKFTNTKSDTAARATSARSNAYLSNACTTRKSSGTVRYRGDFAHAPSTLSRRRTCRCALGTTQPNGRESSNRCTSQRRSPVASPRRSPARTSSSTTRRSRALRQARNTATISASAARSTRDSGTRTRCRARSRHPIPLSSPRTGAGRSRSSASSYTNGNSCPGAAPAVTACTTSPRTAANTAFTRRAAHAPAPHPGRPPPARRHHRYRRRHDAATP